MSSSHTSTQMPETPERHVTENGHVSSFDHQVAGQSLILRYDETTICKCLVHREYAFYLHMPDSLSPFVPRLKGVMEIPIRDPTDQNGVGQHHHDRGLEVDPSRYRALQKTTKISRILDDNDTESLYQFMKLEDLMHPYRQPCILDLKVGVRQHGDDAPQAKIDYQVNKCRITTSHSLGLRLCGMKRYLANEGVYEKKDKFYGRKIGDDELRNEIVNFLHNGVEYRLDLVDSIISQLEKLKAVIESLEGYRFYSCSLIIIYDGLQEEYSGDSENGNSGVECKNSSKATDQQTNNQMADRVRVRIVDFAHATFEGFEQDTVRHIGSDHGFTLGLSTLLDVLNEFKRSSL